MIYIMTIMPLSQMFISLVIIYMSRHVVVDVRDQQDEKKIVQEQLRIRLPY